MGGVGTGENDGTPDVLKTKGKKAKKAFVCRPSNPYAC
jgi:hypothetical protein